MLSVVSDFVVDLTTVVETLFWIFLSDEGSILEGGVAPYL